jgi:hypothetical protein
VTAHLGAGGMDAQVFRRQRVFVVIEQQLQGFFCAV